MQLANTAAFMSLLAVVAAGCDDDSVRRIPPELTELGCKAALTCGEALMRRGGRDVNWGRILVEHGRAGMDSKCNSRLYDMRFGEGNGGAAECNFSGRALWNAMGRPHDQCLLADECAEWLGVEGPASKRGYVDAMKRSIVAAKTREYDGEVECASLSEDAVMVALKAELPSSDIPSACYGVGRPNWGKPATTNKISQSDAGAADASPGAPASADAGVSDDVASSPPSKVTIKSGHNSKSHTHGGRAARIGSVSFTVANTGDQVSEISIHSLRWRHNKGKSKTRTLKGIYAGGKRVSPPLTLAPGAKQVIRVAFDGVDASQSWDDRYSAEVTFVVDAKRRVVVAPYQVIRRQPLRPNSDTPF